MHDVCFCVFDVTFHVLLAQKLDLETCGGNPEKMFTIVYSSLGQLYCSISDSVGGNCYIASHF